MKVCHEPDKVQEDEDTVRYSPCMQLEMMIKMSSRDQLEPTTFLHLNFQAGKRK